VKQQKKRFIAGCQAEHHGQPCAGHNELQHPESF